jgi:hypothetical protein
MAMGKRAREQAPMWISTTDLPVSPGHPFYARLNAILDAAGFDRFAEAQCQAFYAPVMGRPGLPPGRYFRLLLLGYFEGLDSERGIGWRTADSLAVRSFVGLSLDAPAPDHSTLARTRRPIDVDTHRAVWDAYVEIRGNRYSVPGALAGRPMRVRITLDGAVAIYDGEQCVAQHVLQPAAQGWVTVPDHHAALWADTLAVERRPLAVYEEVAPWS